MVEQTVIEDYDQQLTAEVMPQLEFYPDFPKKGVNFLDIFSATTKPVVFKKLMNSLKKMIPEKYGQPGTEFTHIVGVESKGFVLGPLLALEWGLPFVPIRKKGKLPGDCWEQTYSTEYSTDCVQI